MYSWRNTYLADWKRFTHTFPLKIKSEPRPWSPAVSFVSICCSFRWRASWSCFSSFSASYFMPGNKAFVYLWKTKIELDFLFSHFSFLCSYLLKGLWGDRHHPMLPQLIVCRGSSMGSLALAVLLKRSRSCKKLSSAQIKDGYTGSLTYMTSFYFKRNVKLTLKQKKVIFFRTIQQMCLFTLTLIVIVYLPKHFHLSQD